MKNASRPKWSKEFYSPPPFRQQPAEPLLYQHTDGRLAVAVPGAAFLSDPGWHRVGPVDVQLLELPDAQKPVAWTTMPDAETWEFVSGSDNPNGKISGFWNPLYTVPVINRTADAHELWAAAQLAPGESIIDGVMRIEELMAEVPAASTAAGGRHDF